MHFILSEFDWRYVVSKGLVQKWVVVLDWLGSNFLNYTLQNHKPKIPSSGLMLAPQPAVPLSKDQPLPIFLFLSLSLSLSLSLFSLFVHFSNPLSLSVSLAP